MRESAARQQRAVVQLRQGARCRQALDQDTRHQSHHQAGRDRVAAHLHLALAVAATCAFGANARQIDHLGGTRWRAELGGLRQALRHGFLQYAVVGAAQPIAQRALLRDALRQLRILGNRLFDAHALGAFELTVDIGGQHFIRNLHAPSPGPSSCCSAWRPRASRLVSVPIGTPMICAASL